MDSALSADSTTIAPSSLGDRELLDRMRRIAAAERAIGVYALTHLAEIQRRKLYDEAGYATMFAYCGGELKYSEATAYRRLQSADAVRKFPEVLSRIKDGGLTVCALSIVAKHLTRDNSAQLLKRIEGKSVREVERVAVEFAPRPDTHDMIRALPRSETTKTADSRVDEPPATAGFTSIAPSQPEKITPRSPERVHFSFTGSEELRRVIERLSELLWHKFPEGRLEDIVLEAGKAYLELNDPDKRPPSAPKPARSVNRRFVPRWVKSIVYRRDGGTCTFTSPEGHRCESRRGLEYDHITPWSRGGRSDDPTNIRLLCRTHNQLAARQAGLL